MCSLHFPGNFIQLMDLVKKRLICLIQTSSLPVNGKPFYKSRVIFFFFFKDLVSSLKSFVEFHLRKKKCSSGKICQRNA